MKTRLLSFIIPLLVFSFTTCSNDDDDNPPIPEENPYIKYVAYKRSYYDLVADVKEAERTFFHISWDYDNESVLKNASHKKHKYYFDENGAMVKMEEFTFIQVWGKNEYKFFKASERTYTYDDKYRLTKATESQFMMDGEEHSEPYTEKATTYTYDDENKKATIIRGLGNNYFEKEIVSLNDDGRIDNKHIEYYKEKDSSKKNTKAMTSLYDKREITDVDTKGNPVVSYLYCKYQYFSENPNNTTTDIEVSDYFEQSLIYYDGTESNVNNITHKDTPIRNSSYPFIVKLSNIPLEGNVKTATTYSYIKNILPYPLPSPVSNENILSKTVMSFDKNGARTEESDYYKAIDYDNYDYDNPTYGPLRQDRISRYEYDSKYRITTSFVDTYTYASYADEAPSYILKRKTIATYDEVNMKVTFLIYDPDQSATEVIAKYIYKLNEDGTISNSYLETHQTKKASENSSPSFNEKPYQTLEFIENKDNKGNWTERYTLVKEYKDNGELIKSYVFSYKKQDIEYYQ